MATKKNPLGCVGMFLDNSVEQDQSGIEFKIVYVFDPLLDK
jgi:hypothetical protein